MFTYSPSMSDQRRPRISLARRPRQMDLDLVFLLLRQTRGQLHVRAELGENGAQEAMGIGDGLRGFPSFDHTVDPALDRFLRQLGQERGGDGREEVLPDPLIAGNGGGG